MHFVSFLKRRRDVVPMEDDEKAEIVRTMRKRVAELAIVCCCVGIFHSKVCAFLCVW